MEATNFRIGNFVYDTEGKVNTINLEALRYLLDFGKLPICQVKPIPLTEEWLLLFGFKRDGLGNMWIDLMTHWLSLRLADGFYYPLYAQFPEMSHEDEQRVFMNRIESLHELQNLFFAITGQELELNTERSTCS